MAAVPGPAAALASPARTLPPHVHPQVAKEAKLQSMQIPEQHPQQVRVRRPPLRFQQHQPQQWHLRHLQHQRLLFHQREQQLRQLQQRLRQQTRPPLPISMPAPVPLDLDTPFRQALSRLRIAVTAMLSARDMPLQTYRAYLVNIRAEMASIRNLAKRVHDDSIRLATERSLRFSLILDAAERHERGEKPRLMPPGRAPPAPPAPPALPAPGPQ